MARSISGRRLLGWMLGILLIAVVGGVFFPSFVCRHDDPPEIRDWGPIPKFALVDERGATFTEDALRGHPTIISFLFTRCDTICPVLTAKMQLLQEQTVDVAKVKLVSFSVDPGYDTPARLEAYAKRYKADPERWRFVTGPHDQVQALVEGPFMTSMADEGGRAVPNIVHGGYFMLVNAALHLRGSYDANDMAALDRLQRDARYLSHVGE